MRYLPNIKNKILVLKVTRSPYDCLHSLETIALQFGNHWHEGYKYINGKTPHKISRRSGDFLIKKTGYPVTQLNERTYVSLSVQ